MISSVLFSGTAADPTVIITGMGFDPRPAISSIASAGNTGNDYGSSLCIRDLSGALVWEAGYDTAANHDGVGLVISSYSDNRIVFTLGSIYRDYYYPRGAFRLNEGDRFTVYARDSEFSGVVHYQSEPAARGLESSVSLQPEAAGQQQALDKQKPVEQRGPVDENGEPVDSPAVVIHKADPYYSEEARKAKFQGTVLLQYLVDVDGQAKDIKVVRSLGLGLDEKAIEAMRKWRFTPATKNGKPVRMKAVTEMNFRLL
jgi:TonB family protein